MLNRHEINYHSKHYLNNTHGNQLIHLVWSTKHRERTILKEYQKPLYDFIGNEISVKEAKLMAIGGVSDHIHILIKVPPKIAIADLVRSTKYSSTRWMKINSQKNKDFEWQVGYGSFTVSKSVENYVKEYIYNQEEHHTTKSFTDEWQEFVLRVSKMNLL